jgi:peptidoglycan/LPS O-acetylase OafA/YrhL
VRNLYVDRLRGLASLGVVLSHASGYGFIVALNRVLPNHIMVSIAANAYHMVGLFFVISGYLITTKILRECDATGQVALTTFYQDRIARIAPCLVLMLLTACALAAIGLPAFALPWSELPSALAAVFTFHYNHWFRGPVMPRIWDPLWSLSVEEVFYLFVPALIGLLPRRLLFAGLTALVIIGPIHRAIGGSFYDFFSNFDLLAIGVLTAFAARRAGPLDLQHTTLQRFRWAGAIIVFVTLWQTQDPQQAMVWGPEFIAIGAALFLFGSTDPLPPRQFVVFKIPQLFGRLSYEVYLFHMMFLVGTGHVYGLALRTASNAVIFDKCLMIGYLATVALLAATIARHYSERANLWIRALRIPSFKGAESET